MSRRVYLDNAASTPVDPKVKKEMLRGMTIIGNPSSFNDEGRKARKELELARLKIARFLGAHSDEIVFTSSGSEANNLAIKGVANVNKKGEIVTSPIEHPSVLEPIRALERLGHKIHCLRVDEWGTVDLKDLEKKLNSNTILASVMYANNEIGTIEPIVKISKIIKNFKASSDTPLFHVDACQAAGYLDMNVNRLGVDLLTFNGAKVYGPRGIGVLYIRRGVSISPEILGGDQEHGLRAGTENLPAILGLAKAVEVTRKDQSKKTTELRDYFLNQINIRLPEVKINGPIGNGRLANNINISVPDLSNEIILLELDKYGICAGSGSACTARSIEPSHVLKAIGIGKKYINGAIRFSLGRQTTKKDIDYVIGALVKSVSDLKKRYKK